MKEKELREMTREELDEYYRLYACKECGYLFCECDDDKYEELEIRDQPPIAHPRGLIIASPLK